MKTIAFVFVSAVVPCLGQTTNAGVIPAPVAATAPQAQTIAQTFGEGDDLLLEKATQGLTASLTKPGGINGTLIYYGQVGKTGNTWAWLRNGKLMMMCYPATSLNDVWRLLQMNDTRWAEGSERNTWIIPDSATRAAWDGSSLTIYIDPAHYQTASQENEYSQVKTTPIPNAPATSGSGTPTFVATETNAPTSTTAPRAAIGQKVSLHLKDGTVKAGRIVGIDPEGVSILTDDGGGKVLFDSMSDADKATFGFNEESEDSYRAQIAAQEAAHRAQLAENRRKWEAEQAEEARERERYKSQIILHAKVLQLVNDATCPGVLAYKTGVYATPSPDGGENLDANLIFIKDCPRDGLHPDEEIVVRVVQEGSYTYTTLVGGDQRTVSQFVIVPQEWYLPNAIDPTELKRETEAATVQHRSVFPAPDTDAQ